MENARTVIIRAEPIELCQLLMFAGLVETGGEAKTVISQALVAVNGQVEARKRRKVVAGDRVTFGDQTVIVALA
jgi:ribosome-associated protein